ncbi:MAG: cupredoxin family copper-binding protein [Methanotrichaceae archaeon]
MTLIMAILFCSIVQGQPGQQTNSQNTVTISGYSFQPLILTISPGTTVTWINQDSVNHTVTSDTNAFDSGQIAPGGSYSHRFTSLGTFVYHCRNHPTMQGSIVVSSPLTNMLSSMMPGTAAQRSTQASNTQAISGLTLISNQSVSWSGKPLSGQVTAQAGTPQTTAYQMNLNQSLSQGLGQIIGPGISQNQTAVSRYSEYYKITPQAPSKPLTSPTQYQLTQVPTTLYFGGSGSQKAVSYYQYQSYAAYTGQNSLWIQGPSSWTQYAAVPQGASLSLLATTPSGGYGYLYEIYPDGTLDKEGYYFYPYDQIGFYADQIGEHLMMFVINGQPSNAVVIDVVPYQSPLPVYNYAALTVSSSWLRGYNVFVDNIYQATEGTTGEAPGVLSFVIPGDQYHTITIQGSGYTFSDYRYFNAGWAYTLGV